MFLNVNAPTVGMKLSAILDVTTNAVNNCNSEDYLFLGRDFNCTESAALDRN